MGGLSLLAAKSRKEAQARQQSLKVSNAEVHCGGVRAQFVRVSCSVIARLSSEEHQERTIIGKRKFSYRN
jgi:hypothetical protein